MMYATCVMSNNLQAVVAGSINRIRQLQYKFARFDSQDYSTTLLQMLFLEPTLQFLRKFNIWWPEIQIFRRKSEKITKSLLICAVGFIPITRLFACWCNFFYCSMRFENALNLLILNHALCIKHGFQSVPLLFEFLHFVGVVPSLMENWRQKYADVEKPDSSATFSIVMSGWAVSRVLEYSIRSELIHSRKLQL